MVYDFGNFHSINDKISLQRYVVEFCFSMQSRLSWLLTIFLMGFLDIILGVFLVYGLVRGLWNGLFVEFASLVSLLLGIYIAIKFSFLTADFLSDLFSWNPKTIAIWAFILTFIGVVLGVSLLAKFFTSIANFASLGLLNKIAGGIFGVLKMCLILSFALALFQKINFNHTFAEKKTLDDSLFYNSILKISEFVFPVFEEWFDELKK
ncbi:membrane protein required for colicin V production [Flavobacterium endophyticum]|uniref:Membrane protein required for colicin V production n=2 Tax=Flavobacterium endophyticum TaxID=1540163 RepID=A0A495MJX5_9FLAO|nr:membrane protein required for colicin V production [Flavobacterium endophyticum]